MLRLPALVLAFALLVAGCAQLAHADGDLSPQGATVTIAPADGGPPRALALADLAGSFDVHGATYTLRAADGATSTVTVAAGISLSALLTAAGADLDSFDYVAIPAADGSSAIVLRTDVAGTAEGPPVAWADDQGIHFLRPSKGADDANAADNVLLAGGAPLALTLKLGQPLVPRIAVSKRRARVNERIDFRASLVGGEPLGRGAGFEWYFDGDGRARGANVSHRFSDPGPKHVLLNVVRRDGTWLSESATIDVQIVRPRERPRDDANDSGDGRGGGDGEGGTGGGGTGGGAGSGGGGTGSGAPAPAYTPAPAPAPPAPRPTPRPRTVHRAPRPAPAPQPQGELVSGTLIAAVSAAAPPAGGPTAARAAVMQGAASDGPLRLPIGMWIAIGLLVLLGLGWVLESRHTIPFWQP